MSYLLDKKVKRKKATFIFACVCIFLFLFYFRLGVWNIFSSVTSTMFRPVLVVGNNIGENLYSVKAYFLSKDSLYLETQNLHRELNEIKATFSNYNSVVAENENLKEILGRKKPNVSMVLANILSKPNQNAYDILLINAGTEEGVKDGNTVFANGNIPVGHIANTYAHTSKVVLFSTSGEKTQAVVDKGIFVEAVGRGGGNFQIAIPADLNLAKGDEVTLPGMNYVLATVETTISDPRDSFVKAVLASPVNIQELKFVEVETSP